MSITVTRRKNRRNKQAFQRALSTAGDDGSVCAFQDKDGVPHYFVVPKDAPEELIRARAFEAVNGRPMNRAEQLLDAAASGDFVRAYEQVMTHYLKRDDDRDDDASS
jgi:hypothetical protein